MSNLTRARSIEIANAAILKNLRGTRVFRTEDRRFLATPNAEERWVLEDGKTGEVTLHSDYNTAQGAVDTILIREAEES
jgi:hypothetical protein